MKKIGFSIRIMVILAIATISVLLLLGCGRAAPAPHPSVEGLSDEETQDVRQVFFDKFRAEQSPSYKIEYIEIIETYGRYDGNVVVLILCPYLGDSFQLAVDIVIDDVFIGCVGTKEYNYYLYLPSTDDNKSDIYTLQTAYDNEYVTRENLIEIASAVQASEQ